MRSLSLRERNAIMALKMGLINWFQYFEIVRTLPVLFVVAMLSVGCAKEDKKAPEVAVTCETMAGSYYDQYSPADTLTVSNSCTFTDSVCGYDANYTLPAAYHGTTTITVNNTNGTPGCMSNTTHNCDVEYNGVQLGLVCDDTVLNTTHYFLFIRQ